MKFRTFSERQAAAAGKYPLPPTNGAFPRQLRRNLAMIFGDTLGAYYTGETYFNEPVRTTELWRTFDRALFDEIEEYADYATDNPHERPDRRIQSFILNASDKWLLDALDIGVAVVHHSARDLQQQYSAYLADWKVAVSADDALTAIDERLRLAGTIYRVNGGEIIVSTDDGTYELAVAPALQCLREPGFEGAETEFREALKAYRDGQFDQVLTKSNHSFESTMKVIAGRMGWPYDPTATAKKMLDVMFANDLLPTMRESSMKSLATILESDLPPLRNKMPSAGHGRGEKTEKIPEPIATYALNAAASNVRLLVESYRLRASRRP